MKTLGTSTFSRLFADYGMAVVLLVLCAYYSWATLQWQHPTGQRAGEELAREVIRSSQPSDRIVIVAGATREDEPFAQALSAALKQAGFANLSRISAEPSAVRQALQAMAQSSQPPAVIAAVQSHIAWIEEMVAGMPAVKEAKLLSPRPTRWPTFLMGENLINVANQIVVIAVIAVGMTMVIITGGIDLSVGSLVALSAVVTASLIRAHGASQAGPMAMILCSLLGVLTCAAVGLISGMVVTLFRIPPFIATLAMMQVASGIAYQTAGGQSIYEIPASYAWLGRGADLLSIPNAVLLMAITYVIAHGMMSRTVLGRRIYAVGGNSEAARLSGISVNSVLLVVYTLSGALAGLGGVIHTSQLKSAAPTYGASYELYVIAAVVVGGTSLSGGSGRIFGTLIGAFIIAVINNGMNLTGVQPYFQKIVLGLVILGAVLLDRLRQQDWRWLRKLAHRQPPAPQPVYSSEPL